eukprot:364699-Chlamydomonas_euryale.AAC.18
MPGRAAGVALGWEHVVAGCLVAGLCRQGDEDAPRQACTPQGRHGLGQSCKTKYCAWWLSDAHDMHTTWQTHPSIT